MKKINIKKLAKLLKLNPLPNENVDIKYITNDIKKIDNDTLVFYLNKNVKLNFDKYNQLSNCYIVTDQPILKKENYNSELFFFVLDVENSYRKFIDYYRNLFHIPIVAITGTCGKTTTKEIIKQILKKNYQVASTRSSKNNLGFNHDYLMSIDDKTNYAVFETAISKPGYLIRGCNYFKPTIGVITNIGFDHLNGFSSLDSYIKTKGEILAGLQYKGTLIINYDDEYINQINLTPFKGVIKTFGLNHEADYYATNITYKEQGMEFTFNHDKKEYLVYIPGFGEHNVYNALAALAVFNELNLDLKECILHLANIKHVRSHLEFHEGINDSIIVDDTWSSNPPSIKAAFKVLKEKGKEKVKIAVFGKLSSQGDFSEIQFDTIAKLIIEYKIDFLITESSLTKKMAKKVKYYGMDPNKVIHCKDTNELIETLQCLIDSNTIILFKNSMFDKSIYNVMEHFITSVD